MKMMRQGDVLLVRDTIPRDAKPQPGERVVERGELTGHAHRLDGLAEIHTRHGVMYVRAGKGASLTHEEHATLELEPGDYRVVRQREFDGEQARYVND